jgi:hypothetical protein
VVKEGIFTNTTSAVAGVNVLEGGRKGGRKEEGKVGNDRVSK